MAIPQTQGERIRKAREHLGIDQAKLARMLGVHAKTISRWENDRLAISERRIKHLAKVLETEPEFLVWGKSRDELTAAYEEDYRRQVGSRSAAEGVERFAKQRESNNPPLVLAAVHRSLAALAERGASELQLTAAHKILSSRELLSLVTSPEGEVPTDEIRAKAVELLATGLERIVQLTHQRSKRGP